MGRLTSYIVRIRDWMASNRLKLNEVKTQVIWLGTRQQLSKLTENRLTLLNATVQFSTVVNDLGVLIDSQLSMSNHIIYRSRRDGRHRAKSVMLIVGLKAQPILLLPPETTQAH